MDNILVTGVTGQIGHYVAEAMSKRGQKVYGLVRQSTTGRSSGPFEAVGGAELHPLVVDAADPDGAGHRARRGAPPRGDAPRGAEVPLPPGRLERDLRRLWGDATRRVDPGIAKASPRAAHPSSCSAR
jgi:nucleoside-diphosphate-sugar epimerase